MFTFIIYFIGSYIVGFIIGFLNEMTGGRLKWIFLAMVVGFLFFLIKTFGFLVGAGIFLVLLLLIIRFIWNTIKGAIYGVISLFTERW